MDATGGDYLAKGFRDVDAGATDKMARCLSYLDSLRDFQLYKSAILQFMNPLPGETVADLGCGLGLDVQRFAALVGPTGCAIGVDTSLKWMASARTASKGILYAEFIQADIRRLPLASGVLDSCKVDRTLQHVERPALVVEEMFRTLSPGGTAVCAEPDWASFRIDAPESGGEQSITRQVISLWREGFQNPRVGREVRLLLEQAGFVDMRTQEFLLSTPNFESSDMVFDLAESAFRLSEITASDAPLAWLSRLRESGNKVRCSVELLVHAGKRP